MLRPTGPLGRIKRAIGVGQHPFRLGMAIIRGQRRPKRGRYLALHILPGDRLFQPINQAAGNFFDPRAVAKAMEQQDKFVTADAGQDVIAARFLDHDARHDLKHMIARRMAVGVVDCLKEIEIEVHQSELSTCVDHPVEDVVKRAAVFQPGQGVSIGLFLSRDLGDV